MDLSLPVRYPESMRKPRFRNVGAGKGVKERLNREELGRLYVTERLTLAQIAARYECSPQFISTLLKEYGIAARRGPPTSR